MKTRTFLESLATRSPALLGPGGRVCGKAWNRSSMTIGADVLTTAGLARIAAPRSRSACPRVRGCTALRAPGRPPSAKVIRPLGSTMRITLPNPAWLYPVSR